MKIPQGENGFVFKVERDRSRYFEWSVHVYYNRYNYIQNEKLDEFLTRQQARDYVKKLMEKYGNSSARVQDIISAEKQKFVP